MVNDSLSAKSNRKGRGRTLRTEDQALWEKVAQAVSPLKPKKASRYKRNAESLLETSADLSQIKARQSETTGGASKSKIAKDLGQRASASPKGVQRGEPVSSTANEPKLDRRTRNRLARGVIAIDARVDLHGLKQAEAHQRLRGFIIHAQRAGHKLVLVITGKGAPSGGDPMFGAERGVLRRVVPQWLRGAEFRALVVSVEEAHPRHGGAGAIYVRIRRPK